MKSMMCRIIAIFVVLVLLSGCTFSQSLKADYNLEYNKPSVKTGVLTNLATDNTTPYRELITKSVDIHWFAQRYNPYNPKSISDVKEDIGIECLRKTEDSFYSIHKVKQGGLLFIFYGNHEGDMGGILEWFYVRKPLSSADFKDLTAEKDTIEDVIRIDDTEQIFLNIYRADSGNLEDGALYTTHLLTDGLLYIAYQPVDGKLIVSAYKLVTSFELLNSNDPVRVPYTARTLKIDQYWGK